MKKKFSLRSKIAVASCAAMFAAGSFASAQDYVQNGANASYVVGTNGGVIKMNCATSHITVTNPVTTGNRNDYGTSANPFPGIVDYGRVSSTTENGNTQAIQALYFTNLLLSGACAKTIPDGLHVTGNGNYTSAPNGYTVFQGTGNVGYSVLAGTGDRTYNGTFYYDGTVAQTIFPEGTGTGTTNTYNVLNLTGGAAKTVVTGNGVIVRDNITVVGATPLNVYANMTINRDANTASTIDALAALNVGDGSNAATFTTGKGDLSDNGAVNIADKGAFTVNGKGNVTFASTVSVAGGGTASDFGTLSIPNATAAGDLGKIIVASSGAVTLAPGTGATGAAGHLSLGTYTQMEIAGSITNGITCPTVRDNVTFADNSMVTYNGAGAQTVMGTSSANDYYFLTISGGGNKTADCDVYLRNQLAMAGTANFFIGNDLANTVGNNHTIYQNVTGLTAQNITFASADHYIQGKVALRGTNATATDYYFANQNTRVKFLNAPAGGDNAQLFAMEVYPGTLAGVKRVNSDADPTKEINRTVQVYRATTDPNNTPALSSLRIGYTDDEIPTYGPGSKTGFKESKLKFFEGYDIAQAKSKLNGPAGTTLARDSVANWIEQNYGAGGVTMVASGLTNQANPGINNDLADASDIILAVGAVQSIANGRWSDPNTWDEGVMPAADDDVLVRNVVWTGNDAVQFGGRAYNSSVPGFQAERSYDPLNASTTASAANVKVDATVAGQTAALVIDGANLTSGHKFGITGTLTLTDLARPTTPYTSGSTIADGTPDATAATGTSGLWVRAQTTTNSISVGNLVNSGSIMNKGVIEICNP